METYKEKIGRFSARIVEAQKPIRVLDAIKWEPSVEAAFFAAKAAEPPKIDRDFYLKIPLGFEPSIKAAELLSIGSDLRRELGEDDDLGRLLGTIVDQYVETVHMLEARGTPEFYEASRRLYGSPRDRFHESETTIFEQGRLLYSILQSLEGKSLGQEYPKNIPGTDVVKELNDRFSRSFLKGRIDVKLSDGIVADASAGSDVIKIKEGALFSSKDIDIFEVHEGWVHVATTANGKSQKHARFLAKGPPRCVATQEGLAILMEVLTFSTYPRRAKAINDRILGIAMAEAGGDFLDVYRFHVGEGHSETEAFRNAMRVFRGGTIGGGAPFTKDISYCRGFIENYNFIRMAIRKGYPQIIPFLYAGKLHVDDVPLLYRLHQEGVVDAPAFLPPQFRDLNGIAVWMSFSNFLNTIDLSRVQSHYDSLFRKFL